MSNVTRVHGEVKYISEDKSKGMFKEEETLQEREFSNPVAIDIQAGDQGVFVRVEPPNSDPVNIFHKKR